MPPKVDAFADLFLSASGSKPRASMNQQQQSLYSNPSKQSGSAQNSWSDLDLLLKNGSKTGIHSLNGSSLINSPGSSTPQSRSADPFDIFQSIPTPKTKVAQQQQQPTSVSDPWDDLFNKPSKSTPPPLVQTQTQSSIKPNGSINLLDDDFTDAFTTPPPPQVQPKPQKVKELTPPIRPLSSLSSPSLKQSSSRDGVLAELIDIGFPVDIANKAIDLVGPDIQKCVNAIMEGRLNDIQQQQQASSSSSSSSTSSAGRPSQQNLNLNDISSEIFSKASFFLSKGRETVLKNIEQFQQQKQKNDPSQPAWMKNQQKYKTWLVNDDSTAENERQRLESDPPIRRRPEPKPRVSLAEDLPMRRRPEPKERQQTTKTSLPARSNASTPVTRSSSSTPVPVAFPPEPTPIPPPTEEFDLLGLASASTNSNSSQKLDQFLQTDYDKFKTEATSSFGNGNYDVALINYEKCLQILPKNFDERIVILSNLALTSTKVGNYKQAKLYCDDGLIMINNDKISDSNWKIYNKPIKTWYIKLLLRKAESLEMLELFSEALEAYLILIQQYGVNDKKIMDGKRRVDNIVNPKKKSPPPKVSTPPKMAAQRAANGVSKSTSESANSKKVSDQFAKQKQEEEEKFKLHDKIQAKLSNWSNGKEDNLRTLLVGLPDVVPLHLDFTFLTKKITINDIMLPKKVKINYMKVISAIHPDKLGRLELQDKMICQGVFVILNKAWDSFKEKEL